MKTTILIILFVAGIIYLGIRKDNQETNDYYRQLYTIQTNALGDHAKDFEGSVAPLRSELVKLERLVNQLNSKGEFPGARDTINQLTLTLLEMFNADLARKAITQLMINKLDSLSNEILAFETSDDTAFVEASSKQAFIHYLELMSTEDEKKAILDDYIRLSAQIPDSLYNEEVRAKAQSFQI